MKKHLFSGTATALVTPFKHDGSIDIQSFRKLLQLQLDSGIEAIVVAGSTGEAATLSIEEKLLLIDEAVQYIAGRIPVIAGTGSNDTRASVEFTKLAEQHGVNAALVVGPYYNKPTQEGYYRHFSEIAAGSSLPIILYNVPGRTASSISAETQLRLAHDIPSVVATKEASGNLELACEIIYNAPEGFAVLSGEDVLALPMIACGAHGVIAVISNYAGREYGDLVRAALQGDFATARKLQAQLLPLMKLNFIETNPIPVKAALAIDGILENNLRLPLVPAQQKSIELLTLALQKLRA